MLVKMPPTRILPSAALRGLDAIIRFRVEGGVERAIRVQSGNVRARHAQNGAKEAADKNLSVRLSGGGENNAADDAEIERPVKPAIGFQTGDVVARDGRSAVWRERGEITAR
jgi:hypothetical protein